MCYECCGGDISADDIGKIITFALDVDNSQIETQGFCPMARSFVSPPANLLAVKILCTSSWRMCCHRRTQEPVASRIPCDGFCGLPKQRRK